MKSGIKHLNEWLIVVVIIIAVGFGGSFLIGNEMEYNPNHFFKPNPGVILLGIEAVAAIDIFRGSVPAGIEINFNTLSVLFSMVLLLIVGPWMLYKGYKNYEQTDQSKLMPWYWFVGASLNMVALASITVLILSFQVFQNTRSSVMESRTQDLMRQELQSVGFVAAEYGIIEGGFNDSFSLDAIDVGSLQFEYTIEGIPTDSSVIIASPKLKSRGGGNKIEVKPFTSKVMSFRN